MKKESLSIIFVKTLLAVLLFAGIGTIIIGGGYLVREYSKNGVSNKIPSHPIQKEISAIEISADKKTIINIETKEVIFTIDETKKYLQGFEYVPGTIQDKISKYLGNCFREASLSNNKKRIVFATGCISFNDLSNGWIGIYNLPLQIKDNETNIKYNMRTKIKEDKKPLMMPIQFLIGGSGKNFIWSSDDKTITYEADLGLSGLTKTRTINSITGKILAIENKDQHNTSDWQTYRNEEFGFEMKYPKKYKIYNYADKIINRSSTIKEHNNPIANFTEEGQNDTTAHVEFWETKDGYLNFHKSEPDFIIEMNKGGYIVIDYSPSINYSVSSELKEEWETVLSSFKFTD